MTLSATINYLYDGKRVIQERDGSNVPPVTYTRGNDLSGSIEGAGGIGGLLARSDGYSLGASGPNSNTYAHKMLEAGGCSMKPIHDPPTTIRGGYKVNVNHPPRYSPPGAYGW